MSFIFGERDEYWNHARWVHDYQQRYKRRQTESDHVLLHFCEDRRERELRKGNEEGGDGEVALVSL